ncbi:MAG TPA: acyl carrier protein [Dermatophilaceae bacterium]|nr:acyl carrier protein [Dermatophilaceae bacterium]
MSADHVVVEVLAQLLDVDEDLLTSETELVEIEGWDSVNSLRILVFLERELGTPVDFEAFSAAVVIGDLFAVADRALGLPQGSPG